MMLTPEEQTLSQNRPNIVDHEAVSDLHYLGNYTRKLPTNMARMMENAHDWEHLPFVHASSFTSIDLIDSGEWGWRAKIGLHGGVYQLLDLLVDLGKNYWVSTIYSGPGTGVQIHTQATTLNPQEIEVDVRFYLPEPIADPTIRSGLLDRLADQYRQLYDEDIDFMSGRQAALEDRVRWRDGDSESGAVFVGDTRELDRESATVIEMATGRFCVRHWNEKWIVHSAVCSHLLGPLGDGEIGVDGAVTCPWHGYRFNVETGENTDGRCQALARPPKLEVRGDALYLIPLS